MDGNIWKGKWNDKGVMKEQWDAMMDDEASEIDLKLEMMSDLLQEDGKLKDDDEEHYYTLFE